MSFHSVQIAQLLHERSAAAGGEGTGKDRTELVADGTVNSVNSVNSLHASGDTCDVAYLLFLEPPQDPEPNMNALESCIDTAIRVFQPVPAMAHCEVLIPPVPHHESVRSQFATYIGKQSAWQTDKVDGYNYYLMANMGRWRAVPVFAHDLAQKLRRECDQEIGVAYSLSRYITSAKPMRFFAWALPDTRRSPGHCATLSARVLRRTIPEALSHSAAWYGPSSLYLELCDSTKEQAIRMGATGSPVPPSHTVSSIERLLRGQMTRENITALGDDNCLDATRALTLRVCSDLVEGDLSAQRISQKQLASALLRWVLLREDTRV
tara:strand:+ start:965 stop:1930 length:966 start_codon:yes stop_codon:yes gene_type:complete